MHVYRKKIDTPKAYPGMPGSSGMGYLDEMVAVAYLAREKRFGLPLLIGRMIGGSHLNVDRLVAPRAPVVCGSGMGCSCGVRLHATRAEGIFRSMGESYDVFAGVVRCKKRLSGRVAKNDKNPGIQPATLGVIGQYSHR